MSDTTDDQTPATGTEPTDQEQSATDDPAAALKAEVERWKHQARENEKRAKANASAAKELEQFRASQMTEQEKAIAEATAKARAEVLSEVGSDLARARIEAALTGIVEDPSVVIDDLNLAKFVGEDGRPDAKAIDALKAKWQKLVPAASGAPKVPTGKRSDGPVITREQLTRMSPREIVAARERGDLDHLVRS